MDAPSQNLLTDNHIGPADTEMYHANLIARLELRSVCVLTTYAIENSPVAGQGTT